MSRSNEARQQSLFWGRIQIGSAFAMCIIAMMQLIVKWDGKFYFPIWGCSVTLYLFAAIRTNIAQRRWRRAIHDEEIEFREDLNRMEAQLRQIMNIRFRSPRHHAQDHVAENFREGL